MFQIEDFAFEEDFEENIANKEITFLQAQSPSSHQPLPQNDNFLFKLLEEQNKTNESFFNSRNENNNQKCVGRKPDKIVRQRKFPGPAGLLPQRSCDTSLVATEDFLNELESESKGSFQEFEDKEVLSQHSGALFDNSETWSALLSDLGQSGNFLINSLNLAQFPKVLKKNPRGCKVPFLAVMVTSVDNLLQDPSLHLKDISGEMHAILHRDAWENWNAEICPGSVLVLKNVGVITAGTSARKFILNITVNNITAIYYIKSGKNEKVHSKLLNRLPNIDDSQHILEDWRRTVENLPNSLTPTRPTSKSSSTCFTPLFNHCRISKRSADGEPSGKKICHRKPQVCSTPTPASPLQQPNSSKLIVQSLFQVNESDPSIVESLLDGLDTDELFCDF